MIYHKLFKNFSRAGTRSLVQKWNFCALKNTTEFII
eukprot:UN15286